MARPSDTQLLYFLVAIFVLVSLWLVLSWIRIARILARGGGSFGDPEMLLVDVVEGVLKERELARFDTLV